MKVLQVITDDNRRGAQVFATDLGGAMRQLGAEVETVALARESGALKVETLGPSRRSPATIRNLRRRLRGVDVLAAHGSTTLPVSVLATAGTGVPVVYRQISDSVFWAPRGRRRLQVQQLLKRADRIVALAEQSADVLVSHFRISRTQIDVIPNGVPADRFPPPTPQQRAAARDELGIRNAFCVAYLGALVPEKGVDIAIDAIAGVPDAQLVVAGDGPERASLEARAGSQVTFLGPVARPLTVLHAADALVLPSKGGDSMPAVLIEAALCGLPVISTRVGAIGEVVKQGCTGILLDRPEPGLLRMAVEALAVDGRQRRVLGAAARSIALARFTLPPVAEAWLNTCDLALSDSGSR